MVRLISALILVLVIATSSLGQQSVIGTYKIVSHDVQVNGSATQPLGKAPHGYLVITPTRFVLFITADNRKFGTSVADKAALLDTLSGWSGTYRIDGDKIILSVPRFVDRSVERKGYGSPLGTIGQSAYTNNRAGP